MTHMKKQLNTDAITNELRGQSAFFPYKKAPVAQQASASPDKPAVQEPAPTPQPVPPVRGVPPVPLVRGQSPARRVMKQRHPFDIYQDQYETLQQLALEERKQGLVGSMSAMVREAIDALIEKRRRK
jgi:hypothetical protein